MMMDGISNFLSKYFILPYSQGFNEYNLINTLAYALLALIGVYFIYKILDHKKIEINKEFISNLLPYLILVSLIRSFVDKGFIEKSFLTVSPGIYLSITSLFLIGILFGKTKFLGISSLIFFSIYYMSGIYLSKFSLFYTSVIIISLYLIYKFINSKYKLTVLENFALFGQLFDGLNTSILVKYFLYTEKHVLPSFIMSNLGSFMFPLVKVGIVLFAINIFRQNKSKFNNVVLVAVGSLGLNQGLRNLLSFIIS